MSRATRTARGAAGAFISTLLAAVSHSVAGEAVAPAAIAVTAVVALPLCVALAGRVGSVWRVAIAVGLSQFLFHWTFIGLGSAAAAGASTGASTPEAAFLAQHAAHLGLIQAMIPAATGASSASLLMWITHAFAAVATIALVLYGERAAIALLQSVRRVLPQVLALRAIHTPHLVLNIRDRAALGDQLLAGTPCTRRGPPSLLA